MLDKHWYLYSTRLKCNLISLLVCGPCGSVAFLGTAIYFFAKNDTAASLIGGFLLVLSLFIGIGTLLGSVWLKRAYKEALKLEKENKEKINGNEK